MILSQCFECGALLHNAAPQTKYCPICRDRMKREQLIMYRERCRQREYRNGAARSLKAIEKADKEAEKLGMSYGKYVDLKRRGLI